MSVTTNFQSSTLGKKRKEQAVQVLTEFFAKRPGKWHVQFIGNGEDIEMKVSGPGVETSELVDSSLDPAAITDVVTRALTS